MRNFVICVKLLILVNNYILDAGSLVGWVSLGAHVNGSSNFFKCLSLGANNCLDATGHLIMMRN